MSQSEGAVVQVLMMPDYRIDNPYQTLLADALQREQVKVHFPKGYRRVFPLFRAAKDIPSPVQILHLHWTNPYLKGEAWFKRSIYSLKFLADVFICRIAGIKIVWTIHNRLSHEARLPQLELWTVRQLVKLVDRIIIHHQITRSELADLYQLNPAKVAAIPHGHYRTIYGPAIDAGEARAILGLPPTGKLFLNLGMLRPYKGIERLLQTWREHPEITGDHTLLIAGKPQEEAYGQQLAAFTAQTKGAILHASFVDDSMIPIYFSAADVVVLPFEKILTSGSLLLAMSYGKPIIAPRSPEIVETLGSATELLYDPEKPQGLIQAIQQSLDIDLAFLGQQISQSCDRLDWETIAAKTRQIYQ